MKISVRTEKWDKMDKETLKKLRQLTIRYGSVMRPWTYEQKPSTRVFVARNGRGTILGWCAAHTESDFWGDRYFDVDVYVKSDYRRRGVATKLLKHAIKRLRPLHRKLLIPGQLSEAVKYKGRDFD